MYELVNVTEVTGFQVPRPWLISSLDERSPSGRRFVFSFRSDDGNYAREILSALNARGES
jgi:hypothetical protein